MEIYPPINDLLLADDFFLETPAIVYDFNALNHVCNVIEKDTRCIEGIKIFFSAKANRNLDILRFFSERGYGVDIASECELEIAKKIGFNNISATSPSFTTKMIEKIYDCGIIPDFDSLSQLNSVLEKDYFNNSIGLRIKPMLEFENDEEVLTFGQYSRFGCNIEDEDLTNTIQKHKLKVLKFHLHVGEIRNSSNMRELLKWIDTLIPKYKDIETINFGGGITYLYSSPVEVELTWDLVSFYVNKWNATLGRKLEIIIEPGMLLTAMCGFLLTTVVSSDFNNILNKRIVNMDSSAWNLMFWSKANIIKEFTENRDIEEHAVCGATCYEKDIFLDSSFNKKLDIGDRLLLYPAGAYTMSMARQMHGLKLPQEWGIRDNKVYKLEV